MHNYTLLQEDSSSESNEEEREEEANAGQADQAEGK